MQNPFIALGLGAEASREQVRAAHHARVKLCHPDVLSDAEDQRRAQERLVQLNLAYAEAMRQASRRESVNVTIPEAKAVARRLLSHGHCDSALRILAKAPNRDSEWYEIHGSVLLKKGEPEAAHASFRIAVRMEPQNPRYRELALAAGVAMRRKKTLGGMVAAWMRHVVGK
ncbi:MAG: J domain-containing protein [Clostridia bacterium]|nr:J domain-containing protein [Clostridia bacterium]